MAAFPERHNVHFFPYSQNSYLRNPPPSLPSVETLKYIGVTMEAIEVEMKNPNEE